MDTEILISAFRNIRHRLRSRTGGDDDEDALQEAFCRLWTRRSSIASQSDAEGFLSITSRNISIDRFRSKSSHPEIALDALTDREEPNDEEGNPSEDLYNEVQRLISENLSDRDRDILNRRDRDGWEFDEIADYFGISESNARLVVSRARKTIREFYRNRQTI